MLDRTECQETNSLETEISFRQIVTNYCWQQGKCLSGNLAELGQSSTFSPKMLCLTE